MLCSPEGSSFQYNFVKIILVEYRFLLATIYKPNRDIDLEPLWNTVNVDISTHFTGSSSTLLYLFFGTESNDVLFCDQLSALAFSRHDLIFLTYEFDSTDNLLLGTYQYMDLRNVDLFAPGQDVNSIP